MTITSTPAHPTAPLPGVAPAFTTFTAATQAVLAHLAQVPGFDQWLVVRGDREADTWLVVDLIGETPLPVDIGDAHPLSDTLCDRLLDGAPSVALDAATSADYADVPVVAGGLVGAYLGVPIADGEATFGTLCAFHGSALPEEVRGVEALALLCARLLATVLSQEQRALDAEGTAELLHEAAHRDALTGLASRRRWEERLRGLDGRRAAAIVLDLDDLKRVNDGRGHVAGDDLLRHAAAAVASSLRPRDLAARIGGDEFGVLLDASGPAEAERVAARVRATLAAAGIRASLGVATRSAGEDLEAMVARADAAMYVEKAHRRLRAQGA